MTVVIVLVGVGDGEGAGVGEAPGVGVGDGAGGTFAADCEAFEAAVPPHPIRANARTMSTKQDRTILLGRIGVRPSLKTRFLSITHLECTGRWIILYYGEDLRRGLRKGMAIWRLKLVLIAVKHGSDNRLIWQNNYFLNQGNLFRLNDFARIAADFHDRFPAVSIRLKAMKLLL